MTPDRYGYVRCERCGSLRPERHVVAFTQHVQGRDAQWVHCADVGYCTRASGVAKGEFDGGTPRGPELNEEVSNG